jgi:hypothetical protein
MTTNAVGDECECEKCTHKDKETKPTGFEGQTLESVLAAFLYTSENMFGEIVFDAQRELYKRIPPPTWALGHKLPALAQEFHNA